MSYSVTIGSATYATYADVTFGDGYAGERLGSMAAAWTAATSTQKAQALLMATRMFDRLSWAGTRVSPPPALAWPRSGVVLADGTAVDATTIPVDLSRGSVELAMAILLDPDGVVDSSQGTSSNIKRVKAGPAEVEFWRPVDGQRLPLAVFEMIGPYLAASILLTISTAIGQAEPIGDQNTPSLFEDGTKFDLTRAL